MTAVHEIHIYRADDTTGTTVQPTLIRIADPLPQPARDLPPGEYARQAADQFAAQDAELAEALWSSLPGGTLDALIAALLARRASLFRVTFPQETNQ